MTTPTWMLLGFATWTIVLLASTIGIYRWFNILAGRASVNGFSADNPEGADWYKRAMRAHANCIENLPVFGAVVIALHVSGAGGPVADSASIAILVARVMQSLVHVCFPQTSSVVAVRFSLLLVQLVGLFALIVIIVGYRGACLAVPIRLHCRSFRGDRLQKTEPRILLASARLFTDRPQHRHYADSTGGHAGRVRPCAC